MAGRSTHAHPTAFLKDDFEFEDDDSCGFGSDVDVDSDDDDEANLPPARDLYAQFDGSLSNETADTFSESSSPQESAYGVVKRLGNGKVEVSTEGNNRSSIVNMKMEGGESLYEMLPGEIEGSSPPSAMSKLTGRTSSGSSSSSRSASNRPLPAPPKQVSNPSADARARIDALRLRERQSSIGNNSPGAMDSRNMPVRARAASVAQVHTQRSMPGGMNTMRRQYTEMSPNMNGLVISRPGPMYEEKAKQPKSAGISGKGISRNVGRRGTMAVGPQQKKMQQITKLRNANSEKKNVWGMSLEEGFVGPMDHYTVQDYVLGSMDGDYLVRASSSSSNFVLCVNDYGQLANYTVKVGEGGDFEFYKTKFNSLKQVVAFARDHLVSLVKTGKPLRLFNPATVEPWFVGETDRNTVEAAVKGARQGQYLVRKSTAGDKFVIAVHDNGDVCNYQIDRNAGVGYKFGEQSFPTLRVVIAWFKEQPIRGLHSKFLTITDAVPFNWIVAAPES